VSRRSAPFDKLRATVWFKLMSSRSSERKYYLSNLPADTPIKQLAGAIKARWVCEEVHQQLKEALGLDHFEGRSWQGLHRHGLMCLIALAFLQSQRLKQAKEKKESQDLRRNRACQQYIKPSSKLSHNPRQCFAHIAVKLSIIRKRQNSAQIPILYSNWSLEAILITHCA
jgi:hypothetical protein